MNMISKKMKIIRAMPNICASVGKSATVILCNDEVTKEDKEFIKMIFECVGEVIDLREGNKKEVVNE